MISFLGKTTDKKDRTQEEPENDLTVSRNLNGKRNKVHHHIFRGKAKDFNTTIHSLRQKMNKLKGKKHNEKHRRHYMRYKLGSKDEKVPLLSRDFLNPTFGSGCSFNVI